MNQSKDDEAQGSSIRWQAVTITQLSYSLNLILSFTVAILGFQMHMLLDLRPSLECWEKILFILSQTLLLLSGGVGLACVLNRLKDFRFTAKAARAREQGDPNKKLEVYRAEYKRLGKLTWQLFCCEVVLFSVGVIFSVVIDLMIGMKLYSD